MWEVLWNPPRLIPDLQLVRRATRSSGVPFGAYALIMLLQVRMGRLRLLIVLPWWNTIVHTYRTRHVVAGEGGVPCGISHLHWPGLAQLPWLLGLAVEKNGSCQVTYLLSRGLNVYGYG